MATPLDRSSSYLQDLADLPPAHRGPARPARPRQDLFSRAMRQDGNRHQTRTQQLMAGQFHRLLVFVLTIVSVVVLIRVML